MDITIDPPSAPAVTGQVAYGSDTPADSRTSVEAELDPNASPLDNAPRDAPSPRVNSQTRARLLDAVDIARAAVEVSGDGPVGTHLRADVEDEGTASHYFAADMPGYRGWVWCVVVASCPLQDVVEPGAITVSEVALLPGTDALTAPKWVPWSDRVQPGDLRPGDVLAAPDDDRRLVPNQLATGYGENPADKDDAITVHAQLGLGRKRVLSHEGRDAAATRWQEGDFGPGSDMAASTRRECATCGFYLMLSGGLGSAFGVCTNEFAADGRVVAAGYGCGAHSDVRQPSGEGSPAYDAFDDGAIEVVGASRRR